MTHCVIEKLEAKKMNITNITVGSKVTRSKNYQSGAGEVIMSADLEPEENPVEVYHKLRKTVVQLATKLADDSFEATGG